MKIQIQSVTNEDIAKIIELIPNAVGRLTDENNSVIKITYSPEPTISTRQISGSSERFCAFDDVILIRFIKNNGELTGGYQLNCRFSSRDKKRLIEAIAKPFNHAWYMKYGVSL